MKEFEVTFVDPDGLPATVLVDALNLQRAVEQAHKELTEAFPTVSFVATSANLVK